MRQRMIVGTVPVLGSLQIAANFSVAVDESDDPVFTFIDAWEIDRREHRDPFKASAAFMKARTVADFLTVFRKYGPLDDMKDQVALSEITEYQTHVGLLSATPLERLARFERTIPADTPVLGTLMRIPALHASWDAPVSLHAYCENLAEALVLKVFLEQANGRIRRFCKRATCTRPPFLPSSDHETLYCSYACAHSEAQRKYRLRVKAERRAKEQVKRAS